MKFKELKAEGLNREYEVSVSATDVDSRVSKRLEQVGKQVKIPGFRPGKVPARILNERYGQAVMGEILEQLVNENVTKLCEDKDIRPAMQPKIDVKTYDREKGLEFDVKVELLPEVKHIDYTKLSLTKKVVEVSEDEINQSLEKIASSHSSSEALKTKRALKEGDVAVIDFIGRVNGAEFAGGKGNDYSLELGSHAFIPGFEEQVVGHKSGETFDVNVTFPENYGAKELAGKDAVFEVTVKELHKRVAAKVDDELAKKLGLEDLAALKDAVKSQHEKQYESFSRNHIKRDLLDALDGKYTFDLPPSLLQQELDNIVAQWKQQKENQPEHLGEDADKTEEEIIKEYKPIAERRVRLGLVLTDLGRKENIQVTDEDRRQAIFKEAQRYPGQEQQVFEFFQKNPQALNSLEAPILEEHVVDLIIGKSKVTEKTVSAEELMADPDEPKTTKKKSTAKKETKEAAPKKPAAKKTTVKSAAKKEVKEKPVKKSVAKKSAAKKEEVKEKPVKKSVAKKPTAKKETKEAAPKKPAAKKKPTAKKA